jgi:hypothetical protein
MVITAYYQTPLYKFHYRSYLGLFSLTGVIFAQGLIKRPHSRIMALPPKRWPVCTASEKSITVIFFTIAAAEQLRYRSRQNTCENMPGDFSAFSTAITLLIFLIVFELLGFPPFRFLITDIVDE